MAADEVPSISKLRDITANLYTREYVAIKNTKFASTSDRLQAYEQGREAQESAIELLKMEERSKPLSTPDKNTAAQEVWKYVRASLWSAFNAVRNMKLRADYITKIKSTAEDAMAKINDGGLTPDDLQQLTQEAVEARNLALEMTRAKLAKTSRYFSEWLKKEGLTYDELVDKYSMKRYQRSFDSLETDEERVEIFSEIIQASGRSNTLVNAISKMAGTLGIASILLIAGVIVWDICTSNDAVLTAAKDTWVAVGAAGAGILADTLASTALNTGLVAAGATDSVAAAVACFGGIAASFILVAAVAPLLGSLFDLMVSAFSLRIPPDLKLPIITAIKVPLDSALSEELSSPL